MKKESDDEYAKLKQEVLDDYDKLKNGNPFESPNELRDQWNIQYENAKKVYKLSKKYSDTVNDVAMLKDIRDKSNEQVKHYTYECEALEYKNNVLSVKIIFEDYAEQMSDGENIGDIQLWHQNWSSLYERTELLFKDKFKYINSGFDVEAFDQACIGTKYYHAFYNYQLIYIDCGYNAQSEVIRQQNCLKQSLETMVGFGSDEFRFSVLRGHVHYMLGQTWLDYAKVFQIEESTAISKLSSERSSAYFSGLKKIEENDGVNISSVVVNPIEWYVYQKAVYNLYSYYLYNMKSADKAYAFLKKEISKHDIVISLGLENPEFINDLKGELLLFKDGFLGKKYIGG